MSSSSSSSSSATPTGGAPAESAKAPVVDTTSAFTEKEKSFIDKTILEMVALRAQRAEMRKRAAALQKEYKTKSDAVMELMVERGAHCCHCSDGVNELYVYERPKPPPLNAALVEVCAAAFIAKVPPSSMSRSDYSAAFAQHIVEHRKNKDNCTMVTTATLRKRAAPKRAAVGSAARTAKGSKKKVKGAAATGKAKPKAKPAKVAAIDSPAAASSAAASAAVVGQKRKRPLPTVVSGAGALGGPCGDDFDADEVDAEALGAARVLL